MEKAQNEQSKRKLIAELQCLNPGYITLTYGVEIMQYYKSDDPCQIDVEHVLIRHETKTEKKPSIPKKSLLDVLFRYVDEVPGRMGALIYGSKKGEPYLLMADLHGYYDFSGKGIDLHTDDEIKVRSKIEKIIEDALK